MSERSLVATAKRADIGDTLPTFAQAWPPNLTAPALARAASDLDETWRSPKQSAPKPVAKNGRDVFFALGIVVILAVLFLPIPAFLIDIGLAFSIALSVLILMVALWIAAAARLLVLPDHPA